MIELHLIGYTADLEHLVLDLDEGRGTGRYRLVIDADLFATLDHIREERIEAGMEAGQFVWVYEDVEPESDELPDGQPDLAGGRGPAASAGEHGDDPTGAGTSLDQDGPIDLAEEDGPADLGAGTTDELAAVAALEHQLADGPGADHGASEDATPEAAPAVADGWRLDGGLWDEDGDDLWGDDGDDLWGDGSVDEDAALAVSDPPVAAAEHAEDVEDEPAVDEDAPLAAAAPERVDPERVDAAPVAPEPGPVPEAEPVAAAPEPVDREPEPEPERVEPEPEPVASEPEPVASEPDPAPMREPAAPQPAPARRRPAASDPSPRPSAPDRAAPRRRTAAEAARPSSAPPPAGAPQLTPAEIQAELRKGRSVQAVAKAAGTDRTWIERWLPPIEAERRRILERAWRGTLERPRLGPSREPLRAAVERSMAARGVEADDVTWEVGRRKDGTWKVSIRFTHRGRNRTATWSYDPEDDRVTAASELARDLGFTRPRGAKRSSGGRSSGGTRSTPSRNGAAAGDTSPTRRGSSSRSR